MPFTYTFDTLNPENADNPSYGAAEIRTVKLATQERLAVDHEFPIASNLCDGATVGLHKKLSMNVQGSDASLLADAHVIYCKDDAAVGEIFSVDENGDIKQWTVSRTISGTVYNCFKIEIKDLDPGTDTLCDDSTIEIDETNGIQVKDGGITAAKLAAAIVDDTTIEINDSDELAIKTPTAGADADALVAGCFAYGRYTGTGAAKNVAAGGVIRHLRIMSAGGDRYECILHVDATGAKAMLNTSLDMSSHLTLSAADTFTLDSNAFINASGVTYYWFALIERA